MNIEEEEFQDYFIFIQLVGVVYLLIINEDEVGWSSIRGIIYDFGLFLIK